LNRQHKAALIELFPLNVLVVWTDAINALVF